MLFNEYDTIDELNFDYYEQDEDYFRTKEQVIKEGDVCGKYGCQGTLLLKYNKQTLSHFLGCSNFPDCRHTI